jgi:hypothetical protein
LRGVLRSDLGVFAAAAAALLWLRCALLLVLKVRLRSGVMPRSLRGKAVLSREPGTAERDVLLGVNGLIALKGKRGV